MPDTLITVTGGTGFLGEAVVNELRSKGSQMRLISRGEGATHDRSSGQIAHCDDIFAASVTELEQLVSDSSMLIHLAWYVNPHDYLRSSRNLQCMTGTLRLARACANVGVKRFIGIGTCLEYTATTEPITETTALGPMTVYASSKAATYLMLDHFFRLEEIDFVWCRPFFLTGGNEHPDRLMPYLRRELTAGRRVTLRNPFAVRDYLDVSIAGSMIADAALSNYRGVFNVCSGTGQRLVDIANAIAADIDRAGLVDTAGDRATPMEPDTIVGRPTTLTS